ncbi:hypothetical protein DUNSADRAFT_8214 [Dunaliella salina]|uniref:Uncharacterized protein n=1 Tax=Dunaliella salina TaxID=3046 RepID=A0ABQ7GK40_DUNSA|nr:hypothetical protein DUNSADRAFT_8214 [Dunaliella salina]|eukprot:KAF5834878.1 hypothetical protein DUNSADRAFT_8214 [Dunaliella salina]
MKRDRRIALYEPILSRYSQLASHLCAAESLPGSPFQGTFEEHNSLITQVVNLYDVVTGTRVKTLQPTWKQSHTQPGWLSPTSWYSLWVLRCPWWACRVRGLIARGPTRLDSLSRQWQRSPWLAWQPICPSLLPPTSALWVMCCPEACRVKGLIARGPIRSDAPSAAAALSLACVAACMPCIVATY